MGMFKKLKKLASAPFKAASKAVSTTTNTLGIRGKVGHTINKSADIASKVSNPLVAARVARNIIKPGGSVLGKTYDGFSDFGLGGVAKDTITGYNKGLREIARTGSQATKALGVRGYVGSRGQHVQNIANNSIRDPRGAFISGGKKAGVAAATYFSGGLAAGAFGAGTLGAAAAQGAIIGGANAAAQGKGFENIAKGAGTGALTGSVGYGLAGPTTSALGAAGKGAVTSGLNAAISGDSVGDAALIGAAGAGAGYLASDAVGGGFGGKVAGGYVGQEARKAVAGELNNGQRNGQSVPVQTNTGAPMSLEESGRKRAHTVSRDPSGTDQLNADAQGTFDAGQIVGGLGSLYQGYQGAKNIDGQLNNLNSLFSPDSPYAQQLEQKLQRADAGSGRRSQYGTRAVELQARLAEQAARLAPTIADLNKQKTGNMMNTTNGAISALRQSGLLDAAIKQFPGLSKYFKNSTPGEIPLSNNGDFQKEDEVQNLLNRYPAPSEEMPYQEAPSYEATYGDSPLNYDDEYYG